MGKIINIQLLEANFTSSSIPDRLKLSEDRGVGDSSIYLAQFKDNLEKQDIETFLGITIGNEFEVTIYKSDLLKYLADAKNEFYNPT